MEVDIKQYIQENSAEMYKTLKELCMIPAPSHHEENRARYCKEWLEAAGCTDVYIDKTLNVVYPLNCDDSDKITVFVAHTDTVFPDTESMPYSDDGEIIRCPGVGDDTASLAVLLMTAKYFAKNNLKPQGGVMFVCNSCEEGLGNLKGTRQIFKDYADRIAQFVSIDSQLNCIHHTCAGSHRYEVEVLTEGGHSYQDFGKENAIHELSKIVAEIYKINVPQKDGCRTTYNVGDISGGTSVNTIAQNAKMLCEYRSNDSDSLEIMKKKFAAIFEAANSENVQVRVRMIGDRPCSRIDQTKVDMLVDRVKPLIEAVTGEPVILKSASTDCNIPLSLGIPAICIGVYTGGGSHTREEWLDKASLLPGLEIALKSAIRLTGISLKSL